MGICGSWHPVLLTKWPLWVAALKKENPSIKLMYELHNLGRDHAFPQRMCHNFLQSPLNYCVFKNQFMCKFQEYVMHLLCEMKSSIH